MFLPNRSKWYKETYWINHKLSVQGKNQANEWHSKLLNFLFGNLQVAGRDLGRQQERDWKPPVWKKRLLIFFNQIAAAKGSEELSAYISEESGGKFHSSHMVKCIVCFF